MKCAKVLIIAAAGWLFSTGNFCFAQSTKFSAALPPGGQITIEEGTNPAKTPENYAVISMTTAVLAEMLKKQIESSIAEAVKGTEGLVEVHPKDLKFIEFAEAKPGIAIYLENDINFRIPVINHDLSAKCKTNLRLKIAAKPITQVVPEDDGTKFECDSGQITDIIMKAVDEALRRIVVDQLNKIHPLDPKTIEEWTRNDPAWAQFMTKAVVNASYCKGYQNAESVCLKAAWPTGAFADQKKGLLGKAPKGYVARNPLKAKKGADSFYQVTCTKNLKPSPAVKHEWCRDALPGAGTGPVNGYPAEVRSGGAYNDFDMTLFNGLSCRTTNLLACATVRASQGNDGRFWRSPDRVGVVDAQGASFSGDMFNGVIAYIIERKNIDALRAYLNYINKNKQTFGGETVYKSCMDDTALQCVLGGPEWYWINKIANRWSSIEPKIPKELRVVNPYGFGPKMMVYQAILSPSGYRLHLTGVQILLAKSLKMGGNSDVMDAARLLAARQPDNPFFLYLTLGRDQRALDATDAACDAARVQPSRDAWNWQESNPSKKESNERSMGWDCHFMYRLLRYGITMM